MLERFVLEIPERLKEMLESKKKLRDFTDEEFGEYQNEFKSLTLQHLNDLKESLKKEWNWTEEDWHNSMSETDTDDEDE